MFQAEDGIRDLVRSRGLGDVYKRQGLRSAQLGQAGVLDARALPHGILLAVLATADERWAHANQPREAALACYRERLGVAARCRAIS